MKSSSGLEVVMKLQAARRRKLANYSPDRGGARGVADRRLHTQLL